MDWSFLGAQASTITAVDGGRAARRWVAGMIAGDVIEQIPFALTETIHGA